jgi:hypothetical protein
MVPAIDMARRSCPLECFEQGDTVLDELNGLEPTFPRAHPDSWIRQGSICLVNTIY